MRLSDFEKEQEKEKIEFLKQQQEELTKVLQYKIVPHENHTLFEINIKEDTIEVAEIAPPNTEITWAEALDRFFNKRHKKVNIFNAGTTTRSQVLKKEGCIYISALNKENAIKILNREFAYLTKNKYETRA